MIRFEYVSPNSVKQALGLLSANWGEAEILAGGTDLLALMKDYVVTPKRVVNIKQLPGMHAISAERDELRIDALVTLDRIADAAQIRRDYPALAQCVADAASPQIRNMATIGGNLCQRPRCWYFRNGMGLLPRTANGKSLVVEGDNRYHAILGNEGPAYFVSPSTIAPMLIAYGTRLHVTGPTGDREVDVEKFFRIPMSENEREHDLKANELITAVVVPPAKGVRAASYEVRQRASFDWPLATAAVALLMNGNVVQSARIVMGAVAPVPWVSQEAAQAIAGKSIDERTASAAGEAAVSKARPLGHNDYKVKLAAVAVKRALLAAAGQVVPDLYNARGGAA
ncbi:MAG: FAD binding domain-containing protein [Candidatus Acidiferrum sp.]